MCVQVGTHVHEYIIPEEIPVSYINSYIISVKKEREEYILIGNGL